MTREENDFITRYVKLLSWVTDAPSEFQEAAALFLISTAVGRKWFFRSIPETSLFGKESIDLGKPPNLWFILMGTSRITRKTTVIRHVEDFIKEALGERPLLSKAFTPEFLVKEMAEKAYGDETHCTWVTDEAAGFFEQLRKRDSYMTSADAILSTVYDGSTYSRGTIKREKEVVQNPYLTCLLASTNYLPTLFDELHIRLGFMNRFIYVLGERKERKPLRTSPLTENERREVEYVKEFLRALAQRKSITALVMSDDAKKMYDSFEEKIEARIEKEELGIKEGYFGNLPNFVIRLSCIYRLSRMTPEEIRGYKEPTLTVETQDVERAIDYVWKVWKWFEKVIEIMLTAPRMREERWRDQAKGFIIELLGDKELRGGSEIVKITANQIGVSQATIYNALKKLRNERKICSPKSFFYKLKEDCKICKWRDICRMADQ